MTKEEFFIKMENKSKELDEINERKREIRIKANLFDENNEYGNLIDRERELSKELEWYKDLTNKDASYDHFIKAYEKLLEYSKEHNLEEIPSFREKISFLEKHYKSKKFPKLLFDFDPENLYCFSNVPQFYNGDIENVLGYFKNKKEKDIYKWELEYISFLILVDEVCNSSHTVNFFGDYEKLERTKECQEYINNLDKSLEYLDKNEFSFNLLIWTVFKIYHYLRNQNSEYIVNKSDLVLIDRLLSLCLKMCLDGYEKRIIRENKELDKNDKYFIIRLSQYLCLDLLNTINRSFPRYYSNCIMFLAYTLPTPGGCSDLDADMSDFKKYVEDLTNYDVWIDDYDGNEIFKKIGIKYDYKKVLKDNDLISFS